MRPRRTMVTGLRSGSAAIRSTRRSRSRALTGLPYMYGVAISASLAVLVVALASVSLLPALLSYLGPRVDRLRIPFLGRTLRAEGDAHSPAARWSHAVQRRPWAAAIAATAVLLALAAPALGMRLGFPDAGNDPPDTMTRQAYDLNTEGFGAGTNGPLVIAAEVPDRGARADVESFADRLRGEPGVAFVPPPRINEAGDAALVTVIPTGSPQDEQTEDLVNRLRDDVVPETLGAAGITAQIGGVTAALEDQSEYMKDRLPLFTIGVVGLSFLLLLVAFHSPLISLKAAIMNLLSVSAAYGVMTLAANGGGLSKLVGIDHEVPVAPFMPVMMFAILFGLSMDYEVFLISRIREEYLKDGNTRRAVADGLARTARVITAAAAIMVVVFLAFLAAPDVFLKLFGIGLAVAILLDATVVRMVLVPAVVQLVRKWFQASFEEPTPAQAAGWPAIGSCAHTLICAPTGSGKTLAAFLWGIDRLAREPERLGSGVRIVYVSPLKALSYDIERNLRAPLQGIGAQISTALRTGDTPQSERRAMRREPPDILITTPESLYLMISSQAREILTGVEAVIVDEIHAVAPSKRGSHLALTLERLEHLAGRNAEQPELSEDPEAKPRPIQRIG